MKFRRVAVTALAILLASYPGSRIQSGPLQGSRPDPGFAPMDSSFDAADVWVDSPVNGYDAYVSARTPDGAPTGSGDPLLPTVTHRVYARVHNFGEARASNLTVNFYARQPASLGDGGVWPLIGTLQGFGPIQPRSFRDAFVEWTPATDLPASIKVVIEPLSGEASTTNNSVIESNSFLIADGLSDQIDLDFIAYNPSQTSSADITFEATVIPENQPKTSGSAWMVTVTPGFRHVRAGGNCTVHVTVTPPPNPCDPPGPPPSPAEILLGARATIIGVGIGLLTAGSRLFARVGKPAEIILSCPTEPTSLGDTVTVSGQLLELNCPSGTYTPIDGRNRSPIYLEYEKPSHYLLQHMVSADANGMFSDTVMPNEVGTWRVRGWWLGYPTNHNAGSFPCSFQVGGMNCPPPAITCPSDRTLPAGANCTARFNQMATAKSQCAAPVTITSTPRLPATFHIGTHTVVYTAVDAMGQTSMCTTTVTVEDRTPPQITCPRDISSNCASGATVVEYSTTATDTCDSNSTVTCRPPSGSAFPLGTTTVTCTATDDSGNSSMCSFTVTLALNSPPTANAGPDQTRGWGEMVTLNGTGSSDPNGQPLSYQWVQTGGPPVALSGANTAQPTFTTPTMDTTLTFRLRVSDSCGATATDTVQIKVIG